MTQTQAVQQFVIEHYLEPARRRREEKVTVAVSAILREMKLRQRAPLVCSALQTQKFLRRHGLEIESREGPASGQSTTVVITYRLALGSSGPPSASRFAGLRGLLKDFYREQGGAEKYIQGERARWEESGRPA